MFIIITTPSSNSARTSGCPSPQLIICFLGFGINLLIVPSGTIG